jgi:acetoin utilization protein AcuC
MSNYALCEAVRIIRGLSPRLLALGGGGYNLYTSARTWSLLWATMNELEPDDTVLGAVGGMMYGPEAESGALEQDALVSTTGAAKEKIQKEVAGKVEYIKKTVFPLLGA